MEENCKLKEKILKAPEKNGVYKFIDKNGKIIYIGKAKNLKNRLSTHLKWQAMIEHAYDVEYILVKNEVEALILEAKLIRSIKPKFNIKLKDDRCLPFLKVNKEHEFPGIYVVKQRYPDQNTKNIFIGPFLSSKFLFKLLDEFLKFFKVRTCSDSFFKSRTRPCLQYQIQKCSAPCVNKIDTESYNKNLDNMIDVMLGKDKKLINDFKKQMKIFSDNLEYEKAGKLRDLIDGINLITSRYRSEFVLENADVIHFEKHENSIIFGIFSYKNFHLYGNKYFVFSEDEIDLNESNENICQTFILQYYQSQLANMPEEIIINAELDKKSLKEALICLWKDLEGSVYQKNINIIYPKMGPKAKALELVKYNTKDYLEDYLKKNRFSKEILENLKNLFSLKKLPKRIEVYDNSHTMGSCPIGVMITAVDGKLFKQGYKKYNLSIDKFGGDDYEMFREVLKKRFKSKTSDKPDLIIIDGGKGQLSTEINTLRTMGLEDIEVVAMAKSDQRNKGNERFFLNDTENPIILSNSDRTMQYLQIMRDEAHNLAINTHRKLMIRSSITSKI